MPKDYGFTKEEALAELKRRGVDTSQYESSMSAGPAEAPMAPMTPGSENRTRIGLGIGPVVNAQRNMFSAEGGGDRAKRKNPFNKDWGAKLLDGVDIPIPFTSGPGGQSATFSPFDTVAKIWGGQDYQDYDQASKSFEAAMMPIMSGAAVTPSEAQRQIRANLPELGDTPLTLERKATNRAMMANAAAELLGKPRPFPKVGVWDVQGGKAGSQPRAGAPRAPNTGTSRPSPPVVGAVVKGYRFKGGNPADRNSWEPAR